MLCFILGILFMSAFITIGMSLSNYDNMKAIYICSGPVGWIVIFGCFLIRKIKELNKYSKYRALILCPDGKIRHCKSEDAQCLIEYTEEKYTFPEFTSLKKDVNLWPENYRAFDKSRGNVRYSPKEVWREYPAISKEIIKIAKDNYSE